MFKLRSHNLWTNENDDNDDDAVDGGCDDETSNYVLSVHLYSTNSREFKTLNLSRSVLALYAVFGVNAVRLRT